MPALATVTPLDDGAWWRVCLGGSKGNVLDAALMEAATEVFRDARRTATLKAIVIEGAGDHFSFGASVEEHLPGQVHQMLDRFGVLLRAVAESAVVVLAAVRGQCLGGGLELVSLAHRIFATPGARFGQPEITLGVFPPAATILLPYRVGRAHAEDLCLTGRIVDAREAHAIGLVDEVTEGDSAEAALTWARSHLAQKSASSLRRAVQALRLEIDERLKTDLPKLERLYLDDLMRTADAVEGLRAFIEKRPPKWRHA
jgi:cyclohexa-1,5-dienecarbonyl-CoA hydratase